MCTPILHCYLSLLYILFYLFIVHPKSFVILSMLKYLMFFISPIFSVLLSFFLSRILHVVCIAILYFYSFGLAAVFPVYVFTFPKFMCLRFPCFAADFQHLRRFGFVVPQLITLAFENLSPDSNVELTDYGYLVKPGQTVVLTCNFNSATEPQFHWGYDTYDEFTPLNVSSPTEIKPNSSANVPYWLSNLRIDHFNYSNVGNYSCSAVSGDKSGKKFITLSLNGKIHSIVSHHLHRYHYTVMICQARHPEFGNLCCPPSTLTTCQPLTKMQDLPIYLHLHFIKIDPDHHLNPFLSETSPLDE